MISNWQGSVSGYRVASGQTAVARVPCDNPSGSARLCPPHPLQHVFDRTLGKRELLRVAGAKHNVGIWPALRIEERIAADHDLGVRLGDLTELRADVALARIRAHGFR